jgi:dTDP-4-dehydrorhamnose reductase
LCFDPLDEVAVRAAIADCRPDAVINLIAESNVDACQIDMRQAYQANVRVVEILVSVIAATVPAVHLVHISTDHLYDGPGPHIEAATLPINTYALTKRAGELAALCVGATIIRTNFFGRSRSEKRRSFSDWIVDALTRGETITAFKDVRFSAMHMDTLTRCVSEAVHQRHTGVFNVGSKNGLSKSDFAIQLATGLGLDRQLIQIGSVQDIHLAAPRPSDMTLDVSAFESRFGIGLPSMETEISVAVKEYQEKKIGTAI